jgi:acyl-CoA thioesterase-1
MKKFLAMIVIYFFTLPVFAENTILILGDSISAAYGIDTQKGWVQLLQKRLTENSLAYQVVNASISGATTSNGLSRLPGLLSQHKPVITVIELGGNDGLRGLRLTVIKNNLQKMVALAKDAGSDVLILGVRLPPNYGPEYTQQFQAIFQDVADEEKVAVVPVFLKGVDDQANMMQPDRVHPLESAQTIMLDTAWPVLKSLLNKRS